MSARFLAPLGCGTVGELYGWHWGFTLAGVGMVGGLLIYIFGSRYLPREPLRVGPAQPVVRPHGTRRELAQRFALLAGIAAWSSCSAPRTSRSATRCRCGSSSRPLGRRVRHPDDLVPVAEPAAGLHCSRRCSSRTGCGRRAKGASFRRSEDGHGRRRRRPLVPDARGSRGLQRRRRVAEGWVWLVAFFVVMTAGELYILPIGLGLFGRLAPNGFTATTIALWFLAGVRRQSARRRVRRAVEQPVAAAVLLQRRRNRSVIWRVAAGVQSSAATRREGICMSMRLLQSHCRWRVSPFADALEALRRRSRCRSLPRIVGIPRRHAALRHGDRRHRRRRGRDRQGRSGAATRGYGYTDVEKRMPVSAEKTLFRPASISKLFTWTAVMQLVEAGKLDLDHDINEYLDFKVTGYGGKPITLRNLMTHTPGFEESLKDLLVEDVEQLKPLGHVLKEACPRASIRPAPCPRIRTMALRLPATSCSECRGCRTTSTSSRRSSRRSGCTTRPFASPCPKRCARSCRTATSKRRNSLWL